MACSMGLWNRVSYCIRVYCTDGKNDTDNQVRNNYTWYGSTIIAKQLAADGRAGEATRGSIITDCSYDHCHTTQLALQKKKKRKKGKHKNIK